MNNIEQFSVFCDNELRLYDKLTVQKRQDPNDVFYKSLPICIIDAVFSIGVKYRSVEKAVEHFIKYFNLNIPRNYPVTQEYTIECFIKNMNSFSSFQEAADKGFNNRQRTSSRNGILKAEACYLVAKVFQNHGINTLDDFNTYSNKTDLDRDICNVKGQTSGVMLKYLYMLAGDLHTVKPDRHLISFIQKGLGVASVSYDEAQTIAEETVKLLKLKYPNLTERFLDVLIWEYMR